MKRVSLPNQFPYGAQKIGRTTNQLGARRFGRPGGVDTTVRVRKGRSR